MSVIHLKYLCIIELRFLHRDIGQLRDENHNQNMEISMLKEKVAINQNNNKTISNQKTEIIKEFRLIIDLHQECLDVLSDLFDSYQPTFSGMDPKTTRNNIYSMVHRLIALIYPI